MGSVKLKSRVTPDSNLYKTITTYETSDAGVDVVE